MLDGMLSPKIKKNEARLTKKSDQLSKESFLVQTGIFLCKWALPYFVQTLAWARGAPYPTYFSRPVDRSRS